MSASSNKQTPKVQFIEISSAQDGQRIDNFLLNIEKGVPKSRIYKALRKGEVRVNKGRIKQTYRLKSGDVVRIPPLRVAEKTTPTTVNEQLAQQLKQSILYEDDVLLVLNKPAGLAVHAGSNIKQGVIEALRIVRADLPYLELVHRLDRDTSGCLLLSKSRVALLNLQQQMLQHDMNKRYLTLLKGNWSQNEQIIEHPLLKNSVSSGERMVKVDPEGKEAKTLFIPKQQFSGAQLTEAVLFTGRTHQIRVHASYSGHPLAGDDKYGDRNFNKEMKKRGLKRMFLHAWKLGIKHPTSQQQLELEAPLPSALQNVLTNLETN
jgi:23S rRNA pseudouridine955/2504/2580 synthase